MDRTTDDILAAAPQVESFRVLEYDNRYATTEHRSSADELMYILEGKVTLHLEERLVFNAVPGDFLIVKSGVCHRDEFLVLKGLRVMMLRFFWQNKTFFQLVNNRSLLNMSYDVRNEVRRRLNFMLANWDSSPAGLQHASIQLHGILLLFYFDSLKSRGLPRMPQTAPAQEAMQRAKHFIDQNYAEPLTLKQAAGYIGISPAYFSRMFRHEYGVSFCQYLTSRRLEASQQLLQTTGLQIAEIAARCGFSSSSYFIKVFSEHFHVTPKNYIVYKERS